MAATVPAASLHEIAVRQLEREIELLRRENPEMDDDAQLFADMVEGSTSLEDLQERLLEGWFRCAEAIRALQERLDYWKAAAEPWRKRIEHVRRIGHITHTQRFTLATVYDQRAPAELIFDEETLPDEYWKVDEPALRKALQAGEHIPDAKIVDSNLPPSMRIRIK